MHHSPNGLWMQPDEIRAQVREAIEHEQGTHTLERNLTNAWRQCLAGVSPELIEQRATDSLTFLTAYITATPGIIEAVLAASRVAGIYETIESVLRFADGYFRQAVDFIPDHIGLLGLLDDAYMAQRLMQAICDDHKRQTGREILSTNLTHANTMVRVLIGEPTATGLDDAIADVLARREMHDLFQRLTSFGDKVPVLIPAKYPAFDLQDSDHAIHLGMLGGVS